MGMIVGQLGTDTPVVTEMRVIPVAMQYLVPGRKYDPKQPSIGRN